MPLGDVKTHQGPWGLPAGSGAASVSRSPSPPLAAGKLAPAPVVFPVLPFPVTLPVQEQRGNADMPELGISVELQ